MAEILVGKKVCASCGADVRPGALFCYSCGGAVSVAPENKNGNGIAAADFQKRKSDAPTKSKEKISAQEKIAVDAPIEKTGFETTVERRSDTPDSSLKPELKSAAAMRRKPKTAQKKEVEIVWEEQESPSSLVLVATALLLAIFAAAVIVAALTLK